jgi:hypothetical protein
MIRSMSDLRFWGAILSVRPLLHHEAYCSPSFPWLAVPKIFAIYPMSPLIIVCALKPLSYTPLRLPLDTGHVLANSL